MSKTKSVQSITNVDLLDDMLGYHLRRLSVKVMADLSASLEPQKLTPADASILFVIGANAGMTQSEVGKALGIFRANMAPLVGRLVQRGFIERRTIDGRSHALKLTAAGVAACRQAKAAVRTHEDRLFGSLAAMVRRKLIKEIRALWQRNDVA
jgi:DNA-binding MarR family transcriptional regulator